MSDNPKTDTSSNTQKDPDDWVSGDEPIDRRPTLLSEDLVGAGASARYLCRGSNQGGSVKTDR